MGRQIHFHMLPEDQDAFLRFVKENDPVVVVATLDPETPNVHPIEEISTDRPQVLCLWNRRLLPVLKRKPLGKDARYYKYSVDVFQLPLLEFSSCLKTEWEGRPALIQERLYGQFDPDLNKPPEFEKWFEKLVRWIRKNYKRNPATILGGYVGPAAYKFYENGGYLLPSFMPPRTDVWLAEIGKQHPNGTLGGLGSHTSGKIL
jgi:hypothetical protein